MARWPVKGRQSLSPGEGIFVEQEPGLECQSLSKLRKASRGQWGQTNECLRRVQRAFM